MEFIQELLQQGGQALLQMLIYPYYFVMIGFIVLHYRQQVLLERRLFQTRMDSVLERTVRMMLWGAVAGIIASIVMAFIGVSIQLGAVLFIWVIMTLAMLLRFRFICLAYAIGLLALVHSAQYFFPQLLDVPVMGGVLATIAELSMPSLFILVAVLHLIEALWVRFQGKRMATPVFFESKRGRVTGAYRMQQFWAVPLFLVVPAVGQGNIALPWSPLLNGELFTSGWTVLALPVAMGFSTFSISRLPGEQARISSNKLLLYGLAMLGLAALAYYVPVLTPVVGLLAILLHEGIRIWNRIDEQQRSPVFVHQPEGLRILAVLPRSAAAELGLQAGEIIRKANGISVTTKEELHQAMRQNSAFCRLEVLNLDQQSKFVQRPMFSGEHHQLGIVLAPDRDTPFYLENKEPSLLLFFRAKAPGITRNNKTSSI